jgi:MFS transporter, putative metabolite:H+ symporter
MAEKHAPAAAVYAAILSARLDRLPAAGPIWRLIVLLSLGGCFEMYELGLTASLSPGLIRSGVFHTGAAGLFGLTDQAAFAAATFTGLFIGTIVFAQVADSFGRRVIFTGSLLWYAACTVVMALQNTALAVDLWRLLAGIGVGVELVTIDTYISELVPAHMRGRAFAINQSVQFLAVPLAAFLSWQLSPLDPLGIAGWRWVALFPTLGAVAVWWIRRAVPESPRWLAEHGQVEAAERIVSQIEAAVAASARRPLPAPAPPAPQPLQGAVSFAEIFRPPYRARTIMLSVFNFFQTIGFYGFGNWVPALVAAQGAGFAKSLEYSFVIAIAYPFGPLFCALFADRFERKWQIVSAALGTACFGLLFSQQTAPAMLMGLGVLITTSNNLLSYAYHAYQSELFPTRVRARAVGFVYSFSRLSTIFTSFMIAFFLAQGGTVGVFGFIAFSMLVVMISIGVFGPRTRGLALEAIAH